MLVWVLAGCGDVGAKPPDANLPDANRPDANRTCDPTGKFDLPVLLNGFNTVIDQAPRLTDDELELYTKISGNIYLAQRSTTSDPFGSPIALSSVNTAADDNSPSVSSDGLTLFFSSNRASGQGYELYMSTRTSRVEEFGALSQVANVNSATVSDADADPFLTADGKELWFASSRTGGFDIYRAVWDGFSFINVTVVTALNSNASDQFPILSEDKLTVYFSSSRSGGRGGFDIWTAHRNTTSDGFPAPMLVFELNSSVNEYAGWISPDNCRLYLISDVVRASNLYVATRHPM
jgi:Tol biopolymer transport system component